MTQIISNNNGGGGGGTYTPGTGIDISVDKEISIDTDVVQTVGNMVENLDDADNTHYPTAQAVKEAISASGGGDVTGPASSTDGNVVLFDGVTGKLIKDSGANLSSKLDASALSNNNYGGAWQGDTTHTPTKSVLYDKIHTMDVEIGNKAADTAVVKLTGNQTINGEKTFGTSPIVPSKSTDATNTGTAIATEAQVYNVQQDVDAIDDLIPSAATPTNQLADKDYVNDSINSVTAYYITKNAAGDQWATYAELAAATTFYSGGVVRVPTRNDYTIVLADENHDNATTRYSYQGNSWEYQYTVNETALTQAQLDALNSGITSGKVSTYDGYATGKQDTLVSGTNIKTINNNSLLGSGDIDVQETLVSGTNIKTINSQDVLGSGNIAINEVPAGGTEGQVLTKTNTGYEWQDGGNTPEPVIEEKIVYKMNADGSGNLYIPTAGYGGGSVNNYDWKVSVDNGAATQYTGTSSSNGKITLSGYTANSNHTIKIEPTTEAYGWARAFGGYIGTYASLATEIVYDKTYKGFATSATDTGTNFRRNQYYNWTNIKEIPEEYLPDTVTTVGTYFRGGQYYGCVSLRKAKDEVVSDSVTTIGTYFRNQQYYGCTNLSIVGKESLSNNITSIPDNFRSEQYGATSLIEPPTEVMGDKVTSIGNSFRQSQYYNCKFLKNASPEYISSSVTNIGDSFRVNQYYCCFSLIKSAKECLPSSVTTIGAAFRANQYYHCPNLVCISGWVDRSITVGSVYRNSQFSKQKSTNVNVLVIGSPGNVSANSNVFNNNTVTVYAEDSTKQTALKNSTYQPRSSISDSNIYSLI